MWIVIWKVPVWASQHLIQPPAALPWPVTLPWPPPVQGRLLWSSNANRLVRQEQPSASPLCCERTPTLEMGSHGNGCILMEMCKVPPMAPAHQFLLYNLFKSRLFLSASQSLSLRKPDSGNPFLDTRVWRICWSQYRTRRVADSIKMMDYLEQSFKIPLWDLRWWNCNSFSLFSLSLFSTFSQTQTES